jgi:phosphatidate cytidylyltransferase
MAFNKEVFRTRALTAVIFAAVMLTGLLWNGWTFFILFSIVHFGCWHEYRKLMSLIDPAYAQIGEDHFTWISVAGWIGMIAASGQLLDLEAFRINEPTRLALPLIIWALPTVVGHLIRRHLPSARTLMISLAGSLYISGSMMMLMHLRSGSAWGASESEGTLASGLGQIFGYTLPLVIIASIWINDTMAYIVGSFIGKTPLSSISPKKTWEGTIGGVILSTLLVTLAGSMWMHGDAGLLLAVSSISAVAGTFGDLLESKLKRMAGVKDSGSFMPGHGGFLDRFDSLLLAVPFVWIFCILFMR